MNRLSCAQTLFSSSESRILISHPRRYLPCRSIAGVSSTSIQIKPSRRQFSCRISFTPVSGCRRPEQLQTAMDAVYVTPPESDAAATATTEDFISIDGPASPLRDNPSIDIESLVQSISSVDEDRGDERGEDPATAAAGEDAVAAAAAAATAEDRDEDRREELPEELSRSVVKLSCESSVEGGICDVYLVGTAHVSQESCQEVEAVISFLKPQVVFLELCSSRMAVLTPQNLKVPTMGDMVDMWKKQHNMFGILYSWFLAKVASKLEVFPGSEFRVAFEEALKYGGKVILGDRPVQITLRRTWAKMPLWHKTKLLYSLIFQAFFLPSPEDLNKMLKEMDDVDMLTLVIQEMSKQFPTLMETLVHERDQYMSSTLLRVASEHSSVVAVVGKGHLQGIKKNWKQPVDMNHLLHVDMPSRKPAISAGKILTTLGVAVAGAAIISGIYLSTKK